MFESGLFGGSFFDESGNDYPVARVLKKNPEESGLPESAWFHAHQPDPERFSIERRTTHDLAQGRLSFDPANGLQTCRVDFQESKIPGRKTFHHLGVASPAVHLHHHFAFADFGALGDDPSVFVHDGAKADFFVIHHHRDGGRLALTGDGAQSVHHGLKIHVRSIAWHQLLELFRLHLRHALAHFLEDLPASAQKFRFFFGQSQSSVLFDCSFEQLLEHLFAGLALERFHFFSGLFFGIILFLLLLDLPIALGGKLLREFTKSFHPAEVFEILGIQIQFATTIHGVLYHFPKTGLRGFFLVVLLFAVVFDWSLVLVFSSGIELVRADQLHFNFGGLVSPKVAQLDLAAGLEFCGHCCEFLTIVDFLAVDFDDAVSGF